LKILAIDPSPTKHAYVFWDTETHDFYGPRMGIDLFADMDGAPWGISRWGMDLVAVEFPQSYGSDGGICYAFGRH
jgi:hypothetical protein